MLNPPTTSFTNQSPILQTPETQASDETVYTGKSNLIQTKIKKKEKRFASEELKKTKQ